MINVNEELDILHEIQQLEKKYGKLVWYARSSSKDDKNKAVSMSLKNVEDLHPTEVDNYFKSESPEWTHGFNSGMLAGMRYVLQIVEEGKEAADTDFPMLDT
jgi:hypothetical protein